MKAPTVSQESQYHSFSLLLGFWVSTGDLEHREGGEGCEGLVKKRVPPGVERHGECVVGEEDEERRDT